MEDFQPIEETVSHLSSFEHEKSNNDIPPTPLTDGATSNGINVMVECDQLESELPVDPIVLEKIVPSSECNIIEINNTVNEQVELINASENISETMVIEPEPLKIMEKHNLELDNQDNAHSAEVILPVESVEIVTEPIQEEVELTNTDNVVIETEIVKEEENNLKSDYSPVENKPVITENSDDTNNILSQLEGENINLDEALLKVSSHENASSGENNNGIMKQSQVMNKEELLDILEGKDDCDSAADVEKLSVNKLQSSLALQQFIELKKLKPKNPKIRTSTVFRDKHSKSLPKKKPKKKLKSSPNTSQDIVSDIVEDWNDDELIEVVIDSSKNLSGLSAENTDAEDSKNLQETDTNDDSTIDQQNESQDGHSDYNKSVDSNRRAGRVIKKKIIFDPDNPDTFTKSKNKIKENVTEKPQSPVKKIKLDQEPKPKSPVNIKATNWKKPHLKNKNQNKHRLTEVDKLLMDEGAVNMIYQLTPEASKGKKNMRTKAELIKKINQSSTPETKEKKFRERRKEPIRVDHEGKKILSNKQRMSLSSSVKSPAGFDEFDSHSADDSIIYRRHSSSSYSSTCMSPRRLSDVEGSIIQNAKLSVLNLNTPTTTNKPEAPNKEPSADVFMSGDADITSDDTIVKKACLNLKKKLNSTLGQALNFNMKRKGDSKEDKPTKQRKSSRITAEEVQPEPKPKFEKLIINFNDKVAEIVISKMACPHNLFNVQILKELTDALTIINNTKSVMLTVLMSEHGELCTGLDLSALLTNDLRSKREAAVEIADSVRNVFQCLEEHSKILVGGVEGVCEGTALAMLALCDVAVATDTTSFSWSMDTQQPLIPGLCVLSSTLHTIPTSVVNNMVYSNCRFVGAAVTPRVVSWPTRVTDDLRALATKIVENPVQILKKRLMHLNRSAAIKAAFLKSLETERDMLVDHWCSPEGQELIKARYRSV